MLSQQAATQNVSENMGENARCAKSDKDAHPIRGRRVQPRRSDTSTTIKTPFGTFTLNRERLRKYWTRSPMGVSVYRASHAVSCYGRQVQPGEFFPQWHFKPLAETYVPASLWRSSHAGTFDVHGREWRRRGMGQTTPPPNLIQPEAA